MPFPTHVRPHSPHSHSLELDDFQFAGADHRSDISTIDEDFLALVEEEPLLPQRPEIPALPPRTRSLRDFGQRSEASNSPTHSPRLYQQRKALRRITAVMEKARASEVARIVNKLAVSSEPGLTNAQLMLTNFDLKPGPFQ